MPYSPNLFQAALRRKRQCPYPPLQVANGFRTDVDPGPQAADDVEADAVKAAWLPTITGQPVPMQGERVYDDPYNHE